jgi:microcystin-dependent protein
MGEFMFKISIKLTLLSSILFFQISSSAFSMDIIEENNNRSSISIKLKNENLPIEMPIGSIIAFSGDKEPDGWLMCDGLQYSSKKYPDLFEIIKEIYVPSNSWVIEANKTSTEKFFNVPDLRGRVPVGVDNQSTNITTNNLLGNIGGEEKHKLTISEMAKHVHNTNSYAFGHMTGGPTGASHAVGRGQSADSDTLSTGEDQPHNNMQPYLILNYIIKSTVGYNPQIAENADGYPKTKSDLKPLAQTGDTVAQYKLGMLYLDDHLNQAKGIFWLEKAAEKDYLLAQNILSKGYMEKYVKDKIGNCAKEDDIMEALKWAKRGSKQLCPESQCRIGGMYASGFGLPKDNVQAAYWLRLAADQGNVMAQYHMGNCYAHGHFPEASKNHIEAVSWYGKGARSNNGPGSAEAKSSLRGFITLHDALPPY